MKHTAGTIAAAALWLASCGGGTLGTKSGTGSSGMIGPAGAAGASGHGGASGAAGFGIGGTYVDPCPSPVPPVCGSLCGNGQIDECPIPPAPACPIIAWREQCDGDDLGDDGCLARGYGSGGISCNGDCTLGAANCSPCVPQAGLVASCVGGGEIPPYFAQHALAATDTEVAVVVMQYDDPIGTHHLQLERLAPDLSFLGRSTLDDLRPSGAPAENIFGTALAPLASGGWIVAACGQPEAFFLAVDATGQTRSRVVLSSSLRGDGCYTGVPVLAASPNGGPLILWQDDAGAMMSVIAADGRSATPPRRVLDGFPLKGDNGTAAWIGNEFVVALPVETDPTNGLRALRLLRVAPDGTYRIDGDFLTGQFGSVASIASGPDARDVRILYWGIPRGGDINTDYSLFWWRLDGTEEVGPVMLAEPGDFYGFSPAVAVGDDTFVLAGLNLGDGFGVLRVASDGSVVSPYRDLFRNPPSYGGGAAIARRGPGIVVSFIGPTRMHFARLTP